MLKNVPMSEAQSGAFVRSAGSVLVVFVIGTAKRCVGVGVAAFAQGFGVGFLDGAGDHISAAGPFAEIDQAATLGAEREVGFVAQHDLAAGGTSQAADFARHALF